MVCVARLMARNRCEAVAQDPPLHVHQNRLGADDGSVVVSIATSNRSIRINAALDDPAEEKIGRPGYMRELAQREDGRDVVGKSAARCTGAGFEVQVGGWIGHLLLNSDSGRSSSSADQASACSSGVASSRVSWVCALNMVSHALSVS